MPNSNKDYTNTPRVVNPPRPPYSRGAFERGDSIRDLEMPNRFERGDTVLDPQMQLDSRTSPGHNAGVARSSSLGSMSNKSVSRSTSLNVTQNNSDSEAGESGGTETIALPTRPKLHMRRSITAPDRGAMDKASVNKDKVRRSNTYDPGSPKAKKEGFLLGYVPTSRHIAAGGNVGFTRGHSADGEEDHDSRSCWASWPTLCPAEPDIHDDDNQIDDESDEEGHYTYQQLDQLTHREHKKRRAKADITAMDHDEIDILNRDDTVMSFVDELFDVDDAHSPDLINSIDTTLRSRHKTVFEQIGVYEVTRKGHKEGQLEYLERERFGHVLQYAVLKEKHFIWKYNYHDMVRVWCACKGRIWPWRVLVVIMLYDCLWVALHLSGYPYSLDSSMYSLFNLAVAFLLIFRAQQAFAAYRDARMKWEDITWNSWEAQQMLCAHIHNRSLVELAGEHFIALSICAKNYLRSEKLELTKTELACVLDQESLDAVIGTQNLRTIRGAAKRTQITQCLACLYALRRIIEISITHEQSKAEESGRKYRGLGIHIARIISPRLTEIHTSIAECNRIATTPMPYVYIVHLRFLVMILLLLLPPGIFGIFYDKGMPKIKYYTTHDGTLPVYDQWTDDMRPVYYTSWEICLWTLFWSSIVSYAILGLEELSNEMQNPLGWNRSNLPLELYVQIIQYQIKRLWRITYSSYGERWDDRLTQLCKDDDAAARKLSGEPEPTEKKERRGSKTGDDCDADGD